MKTRTSLLSALLGLACLLGAVQAAAAVDAVAAEALAKKEGCFKCHGIDKKKDARGLTEIAGKLKGKPDVDAMLLKHLTTGPMVKLEDGSEEEHKLLKTKDKAEIANLIAWLRGLAK